MKVRPVPAGVACPTCGGRLKPRGDMWVCTNRKANCHTAVLTCPDCGRPMKHFPGGKARCEHCNTDWETVTGAAAS